MCLRDDDVSPVLKFLVFFFNFVFWCTGNIFIVVGAWAFAEKHKYHEYDSGSSDDKSPKYLEAFDVAFDLTILIIFLGCIIFIIAFTGCVGALRENVCLLKIFCCMLGALFLVEVLFAILAFVFSKEIKSKVTNVLQVEGLLRYRDDDDLRNLFDWTQKTFKCCGAGDNGYKDWSYNPYFNCSDDNPSMERCSVPYSCCIQPKGIEETFINTMCGYKMQELTVPNAESFIYTSGCLPEVLSIAQQNLYVVGGVALGVALLQILGMFLAKALANQIQIY